ncbi:MAG: diacylglycerol/lipid kinase family protein, partial [Nitrospinota bacterium]
KVYGLDTTSPEEFSECARDLAKKVKILVVAGGDGTLSAVVNLFDDLDEIVLGYLSAGSGNALRYALDLPRSLKKAAKRIKTGNEHRMDLILLDNNKKAFLASIGIEGLILNKRDQYISKGINRSDAYAISVMSAMDCILGKYRIQDAKVTIDGRYINIPDTKSLIITKHPFYGFGLKVVPGAKVDDGNLHFMFVDSEILKWIYGLTTSWVGGNQDGYFVGKKIKITTKNEEFLQTDGDVVRKGASFEFEVFPKKLRIIY